MTARNPHKRIHGLHFEFISGKWCTTFLGHYLRLWEKNKQWIWSATKEAAFPPMLGGIAFPSLQYSVKIAKNWLEEVQLEPLPEPEEELS